MFKIETSIQPVFRERTLQSQEPEVPMLAYWRTPWEVEREIHYQFFEKRERWFSLNSKDLKAIMGENESA